jgi:bifunctional UDP-N-acetylglucosamine pyrophosphorylase / glucosamine-1-phosphate N-acetyltransferase
MKRTAAIILAAGKGTRMKSSLPKALCDIGGMKMAEFMLKAARQAGAEKIVFVCGYKINMLKDFLSGSAVDIVEQKKLLGSADAVKQAYPVLKNFKGTIIVLYVDTPLIKPSTIKCMLRKHARGNADMTLLTAFLGDAKEYGRINRDEKGVVCEIVEHTEKKHAEYTKGAEVNGGAYCFNAKKLFNSLNVIKKNSKKGEYYLTDIVDYFYKKNYRISSYRIKDKDEALGVNSRQDLIEADKIIRQRTLKKIMDNGVTVVDPSNTYISQNAVIGRGATIYPFVVIEKDVVIGPDCKVGPFANLRKGTVLKKGSQVGNYVEVTRSLIGERSRAKHHSYIGDALIGKGVNIGAGTITANYDGKNKNRTIIEDSAFIGSGTTIVAPVRIGKRAMTGAGSVVVKGKDVPDDAVVAGVPARQLIKSKKEKVKRKKEPLDQARGRKVKRKK